MNWADLNLIPAAPEMVLATALFTVLLVDLWLNDRQRWITYALSILAVALTAAVQWGVWV